MKARSGRVATRVIDAIMKSPMSPAGRVLERAPFIEANWNLSTLTARDAGGGDLSGAFDFTQAPRPPDPQPATTCPSAG